MLRVIVVGTLFSLGIWLCAVGSGVAVTVMNLAPVHDISLVVSVANIAAPFLGGFVAGWIVKKRGFVYGAWIGALYTLTAFLMTAAVFPGLYLFSVGGFVVNFCLGCIGGICGVNIALYASRIKRGNT